MYKKLTVIVNRGMAEDVMEIARKSGVTGGTNPPRPRSRLGLCRKIPRHGDRTGKGTGHYSNARRFD